MSTDFDPFTEVAGRVSMLKVLLEKETLTPLLRKEMDHAIRLHMAAIENQDIDDLDYRNMLSTTYEDLIEHWSETHGNLVSRSHLLYNVDNFRIVLSAKFLEDYQQSPCLLNKSLRYWIAERAGVIQDYHSATEHDSDDRASERSILYRGVVVKPCKEMMIDHRYVETKICVIAADDRPEGQIKHLIAQRDWQCLASTLISDRQLALDLFTHNKLAMWYDGLGNEIVGCIDDVQHKYFAELSSPSSFELTTHAKGLTAMNPPTLSNPPRATISATTPWKGRAMGFYHAVAGGLWSRSTDTGVDTRDSTPLRNTDSAD